MTRASGFGTSQTTDRAVKTAARAIWSRGDYHRFARELLWDLGARMVRACGVSAGQDVLDVACGTGNTALRAAELGARVVACDLTPEHFPAGAEEAERLNVPVIWVQGDAEHLPFPPAAFDVVTSTVGAMWAPDHQAVADELIRVCRPGGTIGMINFAAGGLIEDFLAVFDGFAPPPPPWATSPVRWGDQDHVRRLFDDRVDGPTFTHDSYTERIGGGPEGYCTFYKQTFGPVAAIYDALEGQPDRVAELDSRFLQFAREANAGAEGGDAELRFPYVVVLARRR